MFSFHVWIVYNFEWKEFVRTIVLRCACVECGRMNAARVCRIVSIRNCAGIKKTGKGEKWKKRKKIAVRIGTQYGTIT